MAKTYTCPASNMLDGEDINFKRPSQAKEILRRLKKNRGAMINVNKLNAEGANAEKTTSLILK